jgi:hypothetical protein
VYEVPARKSGLWVDSLADRGVPGLVEDEDVTEDHSVEPCSSSEAAMVELARWARTLERLAGSEA